MHAPAPPHRQRGRDGPVVRPTRGRDPTWSRRPRFHFAFGFRTTQRLARMLDSLVRVSRRVGWRADRFATDPVQAGPPSPSKEAVVGHGCPVSNSRTSQESQAAYTCGGSSAPKRIRTGEAITVSPEGPTYLPHRLLTAREPVVALCPRKVHTAGKPRTQGGSVQIPCPTPGPAFRAEFREPTLRIHPFTSRRFHVLLNSLFKVLFNFPSRYLSAIGLVPVFSLRWSLPPTLGRLFKTRLLCK